jgi:hypothetical protein
MSELEIYGGIVIAGIAISGTVGPGIVAVHHKLEREVGDMPRWADVLALVGGVGFGVALAVARWRDLGLARRRAGPVHRRRMGLGRRRHRPVDVGLSPWSGARLAAAACRRLAPSAIRARATASCASAACSAMQPAGQAGGVGSEVG